MCIVERFFKEKQLRTHASNRDWCACKRCRQKLNYCLGRKEVVLAYEKFLTK